MVERITSTQLRAKFSMEETIEEEVMPKRLRWLGHTSRMAESIECPNVFSLVGTSKRPFHFAKLRWKDRIHRDLKEFNMQTDWFETAQDREAWYI